MRVFFNSYKNKESQFYIPLKDRKYRYYGKFLDYIKRLGKTTD